MTAFDKKPKTTRKSGAEAEFLAMLDPSGETGDAERYAKAARFYLAHRGEICSAYGYALLQDAERAKAEEALRLLPRRGDWKEYRIGTYDPRFPIWRGAESAVIGEIDGGRLSLPMSLRSLTIGTIKGRPEISGGYDYLWKADADEGPTIVKLLESTDLAEKLGRMYADLFLKLSVEDLLRFPESIQKEKFSIDQLLINLPFQMRDLIPFHAYCRIMHYCLRRDESLLGRMTAFWHHNLAKRRFDDIVEKNQELSVEATRQSVQLSVRNMQKMRGLAGTGDNAAIPVIDPKKHERRYYGIRVPFGFFKNLPEPWLVHGFREKEQYATLSDGRVVSLHDEYWAEWKDLVFLRFDSESLEPYTISTDVPGSVSVTLGELRIPFWPRRDEDELETLISWLDYRLCRYLMKYDEDAFFEAKGGVASPESCRSILNLAFEWEERDFALLLLDRIHRHFPDPESLSDDLEL